MMLFLFKCIPCKKQLIHEDWGSFPLCQVCMQSLIPAPRLCQGCGSPHCPPQANCLFTKRRKRLKDLSHFSSSYLLSEPAYSILKSWKQKRGWLFDRRIFTCKGELKKSLLGFQGEAVLSVPQSRSRAWSLKGDRPELIALWLAQELSLPYLRALEVDEKRQTPSLLRQAELNLTSRLLRSFHFKLNPALVPKLEKLRRIFLVDDFMTTGRTLSEAAQILQESFGNCLQIYAYCLGVRPLRLSQLNKPKALLPASRPELIHKPE